MDMALDEITVSRWTCVLQTDGEGAADVVVQNAEPPGGKNVGGGRSGQNVNLTRTCLEDDEGPTKSRTAEIRGPQKCGVEGGKGPTKKREERRRTLKLDPLALDVDLEQLEHGGRSNVEERPTLKRGKGRSGQNVEGTTWTREADVDPPEELESSRTCR